MNNESSYERLDPGTALFITGFISSSVQLLMLREMMNITGGYEMIAGTFLCSWLIGSALGSALARGSGVSDIGKICLLFTTGPLFSIILMLSLTRLILNPGETPSFQAGLIFTFLVLLPFCLISGFTFIKLTQAGKVSGQVPGKSFSVETAGGIMAGIIISIPGAGILNTYQSLLIITLMGITWSLLTFCIRNRTGKLVIRTGVLLLVSLMIIYPPDFLFRQLLLKGIKVKETFDTPYGNITKGDYHGEASTWYNQRLITYSSDAAESEEDIHYGMLQTDEPATVLLISGSAGSRISEISKYNIRELVYVERDPALSDDFERDEKVETILLTVINDDAFNYIRKTSRKFDAVIMLLPPPSSLSLNRYYTVEFFMSVKRIMNEGAAFSCSPGTNPHYFNSEAVRLYSSVCNSLKEVFANVVPVAGIKLYFIASDDDISTAFCRLTDEKELRNSYVCSDYLSDDLITARSEEISALMDSTVKLNRSAVPVASFYYQAFILSMDTGAKIPSTVLLIILFALSLLNFRKNTGLMYFSALALAGYEIILLLMLQLTIGNMYQATGLIIAGLMTGLAVGSGSRRLFPTGSRLATRTLILAISYAIPGLLAGSILGMTRKPAVTVLLILMAFLPAVITGSYYRDLTSEGKHGQDPSRVYSSDLSGSAIGFLAFSGVAVPLLGISMSLYFLPLLAATGFLFHVASENR
jgi:spermidine synthase